MRALVVVVAVFASAAASAHQVGLSRSAWAVSRVAGGVSADVELTFARPEVLTLVPDLDANHDGVLVEAELQSPTAIAALWSDVVVTADTACVVVGGNASIVEGDGVVFAGHVDCKDVRPTAEVVVDNRFVAKLGAGHRHLGHVSGSSDGSDADGRGEVDVVAFAGASEFTLARRPSAAPPGLPVSAYLHLGVEHILLGYDHLCFVLGLVVVLAQRGRLRSLFAVITAFTLAHTITLGLAATGTLSLSSSFVEPMIAVSIVYVGVEAFRGTDPAGRWRITFPFGLIHGFGFAGALAEIGLPKDAVVPALALFNVGVEVGQLAVLAALAPLLLLARRRLSPSRQQQVVRVVAAGVIAAGLVWLVQRLAGLL